MYEKINDTIEFLRRKTHRTPTIAIILGSGLGNLVEYIEEKDEINYFDIPHFPVSTVKGHAGKLIFGWIGGKEVVVMQGRFHYYEGYTMQEVTYPVRVFAQLGVKTLFVSNAAGGMNQSFNVGDLMVITDHINHFPEHPLRGANLEKFGPRFPDMSAPYSKRLIGLAHSVAASEGITLREGVYIGSSGPTFETKAEYRMFHILGADATGMSTVPEVIVGVHSGMEIFGISLISNMGLGENAGENSHEDVMNAAKNVEQTMPMLIIKMVEQLD
ncbi:MAG: purine-nucleoside phosphorylase [Bacteroidales bacterium]